MHDIGNIFVLQLLATRKLFLISSQITMKKKQDGSATANLWWGTGSRWHRSWMFLVFTVLCGFWKILA